MDSQIFKNVEAVLDVKGLEKVPDLRPKLIRLKREYLFKIIEAQGNFKVRGSMPNLQAFAHKMCSVEAYDSLKNVYICHNVDRTKDVERFLEGQLVLNEQNTSKDSVVSSSNVTFHTVKFCFFMIDKKDELMNLLVEQDATIRLKGTDGENIRVKVDKNKANDAEKRLEKLFNDSCNKLGTLYITLSGVKDPETFLQDVMSGINPNLAILKRADKSKNQWVIMVVGLKSKMREIEKKLKAKIDTLEDSTEDVRQLLLSLCDERGDFSNISYGLNEPGAEEGKKCTIAKSVSSDEPSSAAPHEATQREVHVGDRDVLDYMQKFRKTFLQEIERDCGIRIDLNAKQNASIFLTPTSTNLDEGHSKVSNVVHEISNHRKKHFDLSYVKNEVYEANFNDAIELAEEFKFLVRANTRTWLIVGPGALIEDCANGIKSVFQAALGHRTRTLASENGTRGSEEIAGPRSQYVGFPEVLPKAYKSKNQMMVLVWVTDITRLNTDVVVNAANEKMQHYGGVALAIAKAAGRALTQESEDEIRIHGHLQIADVRSTTAGEMPSKRVFHTVGPQWHNYRDKKKCSDDLYRVFYQCLHEAQQFKFTSIAFPAISSGIYGVPEATVAEAGVRAILAFCKTYQSPHLTHVHIVDIQTNTIKAFQSELQKHTKELMMQPGFNGFDEWIGRRKRKISQRTGTDDMAGLMSVQIRGQSLDGSRTDGGKEDENCSICISKPTNPKVLPQCKHRFCTGCIEQCFEKNGPKCPNCGTIYGEMRGNQPDGTMRITKEDKPLPGFDSYGALRIHYDIPGGRQTDKHPNPGRSYNGTSRTAYLPNNREGQTVLTLLQRAFDAKMIFTVGRSSTTGCEDQVVWNGIHHKTSRSGRYGYPDPTYLARVQEELAAQGFN